MIRVVVVDDHPVVSQGLAAVLQDHPSVQVVATASSDEEARDVVARWKPDVAVVDLTLGTQSAIELLRYFKQGGVRTLVYTAHDSQGHVVGALDAGAGGYVLKGSPLADIVTAVERVHAGGTHLDPRVAGHVVSSLRGGPGGALSARQSEVLKLIAEGLSTAQMAERTGLSERTVKFHVNGIFNKLGADNRAQAVAVAAQRGWL